VLLENRALQAFDEPVGPGVARFAARVPEAQLAAGRIKRPLELGAAIREDATHGPVGAPMVRDDDAAQEGGGGRGIVGGQQTGQPVRAGRIARRDLPDFADAFEGADVEGVQTHELAGLLRFDVTRPAVARTPQTLAGAFRQQPGGARRLLLEHGQSGAWPSRPGAAAAAGEQCGACEEILTAARLMMEVTNNATAFLNSTMTICSPLQRVCRITRMTRLIQLIRSQGVPETNPASRSDSQPEQFGPTNKPEQFCSDIRTFTGRHCDAWRKAWKWCTGPRRFTRESGRRDPWCNVECLPAAGAWEDSNED